MRALRPLALAAALAVLPACTDSGPKTGEDGDPSAAARGRLAVLAQATANGEFDATYRFVQNPSNATGIIRIRQVPPRYRIDVASKGSATFLVLDTGIVSCAVKGRNTSCFLVAKPGEELPALFDPGVQRLFRDAVEELARNPNDYRVTLLDATIEPQTPSSTPTPTARASASASSAPLPPGVCFGVERVSVVAPAPGSAAAGFENGTYCFAERGVATRIEVQSGVLELVGLGGEPNSTWFIPPAKVQQLPELSASPTTGPSARPSATR